MITDLDPTSAILLFVRYNSWTIPWDPTHASRSWFPMEGSIELLHSVIDNVDEWVPNRAWRVVQKGYATWKITVGSKIKLMTEVDIQGTIDWIKNTAVTNVYWSEATGFCPKAGALGLAYPEKDIILVWPDKQLRWLVVGNNQSPHGRGVFVFKEMKADANGNPHPMKLALLP